MIYHAACVVKGAQVSLRFWAFAFHFISEQNNRAAAPTAAQVVHANTPATVESDTKMSLADAELLTSADERAAQPNCRAAHASCSESQVTSLIKCM
jgi:hypothetical protein